MFHARPLVPDNRKNIPGPAPPMAELRSEGPWPSPGQDTGVRTGLRRPIFIKMFNLRLLHRCPQVARGQTVILEALAVPARAQPRRSGFRRRTGRRNAIHDILVSSASGNSNELALKLAGLDINKTEGEKDAQRSSTEQSGEAEGEAAKPQS
ncbi:hypothetical protein QTO34_007842 [Cnephaeus nilssonii]|uniref:cAMP-dependent protein kinase inhibitor beta n=1 Tax=Cnephaeus nilssonii TaxID=3371016 RepID=A0AA40HJ52_CNENI|nr:hypothetical protein QTO34_007842 [Eptesicus nilssonii]